MTGEIQWGFVPNLWPRGTVQRLDNWGWQIYNPNVVLRSIDQVSSATFLKPNDCDQTKLNDTEPPFGQCSEIDSSDDNIMWKDLLDSLENFPLIAYPVMNGSVKVTAEIPRGFFERNGL